MVGRDLFRAVAVAQAVWVQAHGVPWVFHEPSLKLPLALAHRPSQVLEQGCMRRQHRQQRLAALAVVGQLDHAGGGGAGGQQLLQGVLRQLGHVHRAEQQPFAGMAFHQPVQRQQRPLLRCRLV